MSKLFMVLCFKIMFEPFFFYHIIKTIVVTMVLNLKKIKIIGNDYSFNFLNMFKTVVINNDMKKKL